MEPTRELNEKEMHTVEEIKKYAAELEEANIHLENAIRVCTNERAKEYLQGVKNDLRRVNVGLDKAKLNIVL